MRVAINGMFWNQPTVGSGQYLHGLLGALTEISSEHEFVLLLPTTEHSNVGTFKRSNVQFVAVPTPFDQRSANFAKLWFEQIGVPQMAARIRADVLHVPYFAPPLRSRVPVVASVLDIIPLVLPEYRGGRSVRAYMRVVANAAPRAAQIIAISNDSRKDIIERLGCDPNRVTTTYLAAGSQYRPLDRAAARAEVAARYGLHSPFVYYVGGLDARKNVEMLLSAWWWLRRAGGPPGTLAIAGRALGTDPRLFPNLDLLIAALGIQQTVARIDVPSVDGPLLYNAATAFAFPSYYEGFGLPPLEAMACGTPTVVADASSLPEVVGDAALQMPLDNLEEWVVALWRLLADPALRAELRQRGLARAAQFSYEQTARQTVEVYARALAR